MGMVSIQLLTLHTAFHKLKMGKSVSRQIFSIFALFTRHSDNSSRNRRHSQLYLYCSIMICWREHCFQKWFVYIGEFDVLKGDVVVQHLRNGCTPAFGWNSLFSPVEQDFSIESITQCDAENMWCICQDENHFVLVNIACRMYIKNK